MVDRGSPSLSLHSKPFRSSIENLHPGFAMSTNPAVERYGWTAVPRKVELLLQQSQASGLAVPISVSSIKLPDSALVKAVHEYAKKELPIETFNHSMRVYYYGNLTDPSSPQSRKAHRTSQAKQFSPMLSHHGPARHLMRLIS